MSNNTMGFKSFHPYPDILNLYGAKGRVLGIVRRLQRRGMEAIVEQITRGQPLHAAQLIHLPDTIEKAEHDSMQRALKGRG